jgi:hypothetical protein
MLSVDVIKAIDEFAFKSTPYPVVLSIENHCSLPQQAIMAEVMIDIFGDKLFMPQKFEKDDFLPSLEELKYKILVKGKRPNSTVIAGKTASTSPSVENTEADDDKSESEDEDEDDEGDEPANDPKTGKPIKTRKQLLKKQQEEEAHAAGKKVKKEKTHHKLAQITFLGTTHCKSFEKSKSDEIPADKMTSYAEAKTMKYLRNPDILSGWIEHNKKHLR